MPASHAAVARTGIIHDAFSGRFDSGFAHPGHERKPGDTGYFSAPVSF